MPASSRKVSPPFVIVMGPPASGKSTLVREILSDNPELDRFRVSHQIVEEKRNGTDLWQAVRASAEQRSWIPDAIVMEMFARRLRRRAAAMLLEGLPANGTQAVRVRELLDAHGVPARLILYLDAPDQVCAARVAGRRVCHRCDDGMAPTWPDPAAPDRCGACGGLSARREDDTAAAFTERLRIHRRNTPAVLAAFRPDEIVVLDATRAPAAIAAAARAALRCPPVMASGGEPANAVQQPLCDGPGRRVSDVIDPEVDGEAMPLREVAGETQIRLAGEGRG